MISATPVVQIPAATTPPPPPPAAPIVVKAGQATAPGQLAKLAVAEARAAGADLPANAQGKAASAIARGADPADLFALQLNLTDTGAGDDTAAEPVSPPSGETPATGGTPSTDASVPFAPAEEAAAAELAKAELATAEMIALQAYQVSATVFAGGGDSSAQTALDLLS